MQLVTAGLALASASAIYYFLSLTRSYAAARKTRLPIVLTPIDPFNTIWLIFCPLFTKILYPFCPEWLFFRVDMSVRGWEFRLRNRPHDAFGSSFMLVGPGSMSFYTKDAEVIKTVTGHTTHKNFLQSKFLEKAGSIFGPQLLAANGEDWQRQRRIIAPVINERISAEVWNESVKQAQEMLQHFTRGIPQAASTRTTDRSVEGLRRIAINVLGAAAYGTPRPWIEDEERPPSGYQLGFINSLLAIGNQYAAAIFFSSKMLSLPFLPASIRKVGIAKEEFQRYCTDMIAQERASADVEKNNIMSAMVQASDQEKRNTGKSDRHSLHLSEDEIRGNLFLFTIAGYDTTANTMGFALTLLALHPEWQDWIIQELDQIHSQNEDLSYEQVFPRLKRCLALMFETLRLYSPLEHLARLTPSPQTITTTSGSKHTIPGGIDVFLSQAGAHVDPEYWAPDPLEWRPSRWIISQGSSDNNQGASEVGQESLWQPEKCTFIPWATGPRHCPGMKMAQVEFAAVFATLFRHCRVKPVLMPGEKTMEQARNRLEQVLRTASPKMALQILEPRQVVIRWVKR